MIDLIRRLHSRIYNYFFPNNVTDSFAWEDLVHEEREIRERELDFNEKYPSVKSFCPKDWTCSVCINNIEHTDKYKMLTCNHYFHEECITIWVVNTQKNKCPICKKRIM